jgi:hypothetical protein
MRSLLERGAVPFLIGWRIGEIFDMRRCELNLETGISPRWLWRSDALQKLMAREYQ